MFSSMAEGNISVLVDVCFTAFFVVILVLTFETVFIAVLPRPFFTVVAVLM